MGHMALDLWACAAYCIPELTGEWITSRESTAPWIPAPTALLTAYMATWHLHFQDKNGALEKVFGNCTFQHIRPAVCSFVFSYAIGSWLGFFCGN